MNRLTQRMWQSIQDRVWPELPPLSSDEVILSESQSAWLQRYPLPWSHSGRLTVTTHRVLFVGSSPGYLTNRDAWPEFAIRYDEIRCVRRVDTGWRRVVRIWSAIPLAPMFLIVTKDGSSYRLQSFEADNVIAAFASQCEASELKRKIEELMCLE